MFCRHCGVENEPDASFCTACGKSTAAASLDTTGAPAASVRWRGVAVSLATYRTLFLVQLGLLAVISLVAVATAEELFGAAPTVLDMVAEFASLVLSVLSILALRRYTKALAGPETGRGYAHMTVILEWWAVGISVLTTVIILANTDHSSPTDAEGLLGLLYVGVAIAAFYTLLAALNLTALTLGRDAIEKQILTTRVLLLVTVACGILFVVSADASGDGGFPMLMALSALITGIVTLSYLVMVLNSIIAAAREQASAALTFD